MPEKYKGTVVEIIYMDRKGQITKRSIEVYGIKQGMVTAKCLKTGQIRSFRVENILAVQPKSA
ncbi:hypothetical protein AWM70_08655 [Paenibacillus yonginensis]|uniref:Uncharacterized protein n=1 Tax=Paenibacillus yonginensis TaxID=1462996 RepID=A0A1B1MZP5_9BACL|nr:hypothetical protein [Paenibacillus yonginensis]ANS74647.1 hypothetical protein AWM70_08655 [Paenibacillus yonginensis]